MRYGAGLSTATTTDRRWSVAEILQFAFVITLLIGNFTGTVTWCHGHGGLPVKPRDFNLALGQPALALLLFNRPGFCLPSLALLTIPL